MQVGHLQIGDWWEADRAMADWPGRRCKPWGKYTRVDMRVIYIKADMGNCGWGKIFWTTDLKKYKIADLVRESKRRFRLIVKLIAIEYIERLLCYLSSYINLLMLDLWLNLDLWPRDDILPLSRLLLTRCLVEIVIVIIICFWHCLRIGSWSY